MNKEHDNHRPMEEASARFDEAVLDIDCAAATEEIGRAVRRIVGRRLHRRGAVVGVSGGVDSAVCVSLAAKALGPERVFALLMPEHDSDSGSTARGEQLCGLLGVQYVKEDIAPVLESLGCYRRRDEAIGRLFPEYGPGYRQKIAVADDLLGQDRVNYFNLIIESPDGKRKKERMPMDVYLQVVAATNMKQRTRKLMEYFHAERLNYAVIGTPNLLEYDQGFFVRGGDGLADLKPIAHLYKTQVYALAKYLGVPEEITSRPPSTDTYSLPQTQGEFYFALPYHQMDMLLWAFQHEISAEEAGCVLGLDAEQVLRAYRDIVAKRRISQQLHQTAIQVDEEIPDRSEATD